jgi:hypothetical protein
MANFKVGDTVYLKETAQLGIIHTLFNDSALIQWTDGDVSREMFDDISLHKPKPFELQEPQRLARIKRWAGLAMQGMLSDVVTSGSYVEIAEYAFNYAEAMEAEYQRRYFNTNENTNETDKE